MCADDDLLCGKGLDSNTNSPTNAQLSFSSNDHVDEEQDMTRELMEEINAADGNELNVRINE